MKPILYLAPIQGITDRIYRNIYSKFFDGFDYAVAPFIATSRRSRNDRKLLVEYAQAKNTGMSTIPQILSNNPADFIQLANSLYEMGYKAVNWNLGCPYPTVVKKGKGAGLLCYPAKIESFLDEVVPSVKANISIKVRLGLVYSDEILDLIPLFNKHPLAELIIHPRTGRQMYQGNVDLDAFEQCIKWSRHPVVYNGDITTMEDYKKLRSRFTSIERWMIGRGALSNPFLAGEIKDMHNLAYGEKMKILYSFHNELWKEYSSILSGPKHIMDRMKSEWTYLANIFPSGIKIQKKIRKLNNTKHYLELVDQIFDDVLHGDSLASGGKNP